MLYLHDAALYRAAYLSIMQLRSTIRTIELENRHTNVRDSASFLRPFTSSECVSFLNPYNRRNPRNTVEHPFATLGGTLNLEINPDTRPPSFLRALSFLPLAVHVITLHKSVPRVTKPNRTLIARVVLVLPSIPSHGPLFHRTQSV